MNTKLARNIQLTDKIVLNNGTYNVQSKHINNNGLVKLVLKRFLSENNNTILRNFSGNTRVSVLRQRTTRNVQQQRIGNFTRSIMQANANASRYGQQLNQIQRQYDAQVLNLYLQQMQQYQQQYQQQLNQIQRQAHLYYPGFLYMYLMSPPHNLRNRNYSPQGPGEFISPPSSGVESGANALLQISRNRRPNENRIRRRLFQ